MEARQARGHNAARSVTTALDPPECAGFPVAAQAVAPETAASKKQFTFGENSMSAVVYVSNVRIERKVGPLRIAYLPGESQPVIFSVHGAVAEHYKIDPATLKESHASTLDYVIAATAG